MKGRFLTAAEIAEFKNHLTLEERSAATIEKYIRDVRAFAAYAPDGEITKETVIAYKKHLQEIYAVRSVNSMPSAAAICFTSRRKSSSACRSISARYEGLVSLSAHNRKKAPAAGEI